ncbi:DUF371 domain-containing protein [Candidatus Bathyarchaeota archaeon]|nr:DUF371 domain-containing protein [Candidatus Bathyarchaeota archaeon]
MKVEDSFKAWGHPNIQGTHKTTIMTTKDTNLSLKGDCIVAVSSEKSINELSEEVKNATKNSDAIIRLIFTIESESVVITGKGDPRLTFENIHDIVTRKSSFICPRTLMIQADKASIDLPRSFIMKMKNPKTIMKINIKVMT